MNKIIIIIISIGILTLNIPILRAEDKIEKEQSAIAPSPKEKVIFFYFQNKDTTENYEYLSSIIPDAIAKDIKTIGEYEVETFPVKVDYLESGSSAEDMNNFIRLLSDTNKEVKTDFMLIGSFFIEDKQIIIMTQLFDVETQKIIYIEKTKSRLSAYVLDMIENATNNIHLALTKLSKIKKEERAKSEEEKKARVSPFLGLYNALSGITFGFNYGRTDFFTDGIYKNADYVSPYLSYAFNYFAITGKFEYFGTRTRESYNKEDNRERELEFTGGSLNLSYLLKFNTFFNIAVTAGGGMANVELIVKGDKDSGIPPVALEDSLKPYYTFSVSMNFYIGNLKLESGWSYNIIHISEKIDYSVIYFGIGYRI